MLASFLLGAAPAAPPPAPGLPGQWWESLHRAILGQPEPTGVFSIADVAVVLALSFLLNLTLAWAYRRSHRGVSYSQSFVQTLVLVGVTISLVMLIIGSNIARAFTLVGALSIIRFRNAVKETRDVGFVFVSMAIGMAVGTRFYAEAAFGTAFLVALTVLMHRLNLFAKEIREKILRIQVPADLDYRTAFQDVFQRHLDDAALISVESVRAGALLELVYSVTAKRRMEETRFLSELRGINGNQRIALIVGQQEIDL